MTSKTKGWMIFIAAIGMLFGLIAVDFAKIDSYDYVTKPQFMADMLGHIATVITAFIGGRLIPENRSGKKTRDSDPES